MSNVPDLSMYFSLLYQYGGDMYNEDGTKTVTMTNLKLKNVEHDSEFFFPILDGALQYHGYMYELSL